MDKTIFIPSAVLGFVFMLIYLIRCHRSNNPISLSIMISSILQSSGLVCGCFLIASTVSDKVKQIIQEIDIYIFIAGIAIIFVSAKGLCSDIFKVFKAKENKI